MQVIPEVVPPQGPMQLTVPQIYRMPSPSCDTQLEELRTQKSQVHRRSEGCLDLSAVGRNMWPQQNQHHHRASLPSVQIFSASGHRSGFETPSPVPSYIRDSPSPNYVPARDPPSPGYFHGDPPSPFRSQCGSTLGVGVRGAQPNMLSPLQWATGPGCMSGRMSGYDTSINQHGTWPAYGGVSPLSTGTAETSSWAAVQDCSDVSDDSSTEDQFFAVGKDLSHMIGSKNGSSDEDVGNVHHGPKNSWPPPPPHSSTLLTRGVTPDLLEPPELYNAHRPIQMQWSDPLSSRSMWANSPQDINQHKTSQSMQGFGGVQ
ncbi:unnamed protein product [Lymnaea stagnalis]|uniref:Uncharacterized protein n=1 Tax=Lymnaea stagnalis TaxID=6523 RepID=A0AAV2IDD2_LYMST